MEQKLKEQDVDSPELLTEALLTGVININAKDNSA